MNVAKMIAAECVGKSAEEIAVRIEIALRVEREECASICDHREQLWRNTEESAEKPPHLRGEARQRSIEAAWIGDAIRARE